MQRRHPLPNRWLMTDERQSEMLWTALARLSRGAGIVFRHHATPPAARRALYEQVRRIARRRGLVLVLAGTPEQAIAWHADGAHGRSPHRLSSRRLMRTAPVHDARERHRARHADLLFVSPVFPTRSHPGAASLGPLRFAALTASTLQPVIALGGMNAINARRLQAYGWAAIDAWSDPPPGRARIRT